MLGLSPKIMDDFPSYYADSDLIMVRDLDTITEVSENSCNSTLRDYNGHEFNTCRGRIRTQPMQIDCMDTTDQENRFLRAYQNYHDDHVTDWSSDSSRVCSISDSDSESSISDMADADHGSVTPLEASPLLISADHNDQQGDNSEIGTPSPGTSSTQKDSEASTSPVSTLKVDPAHSFATDTTSCIHLCTATATSQVILNEPNNSARILAESSATATHENPYLALLKASIKSAFEAISKCQGLSQDKISSTISLSVNSMLTTNKGESADMDSKSGTRKSKSGFFQQFTGSGKRDDIEYADADYAVASKPQQKPKDTLATSFDAAQLRRLLSAPYYAVNEYEDPNPPLNDSISSTVMNETMISTQSNDDSVTSRPSTGNSWRFWDYKWFRSEQKKRQLDSDEESRRSRRNKYKSKIDKAKHSYLQQQPFVVQENGKKPISRLPEPPSVPVFKSTHSESHAPGPEFKLRPPEAKYESEYEKIVREAEQNWSTYRRKLSNPSNTRALSTGVLETDLDTGHQIEIRPAHVLETDLDQVQNDIEREGRKRNKDMAYKSSPPTHNRAKSADCAMDQKQKSDLRPPENELRKLLFGDIEDEKNLSEHELRFRKSMEKLQIPDWYLYSQHFARSRSPSKTRATERPKSTLSYKDKIAHQDTSPSVTRRWTKAEFDVRKSISFGHRYWPEKKADQPTNGQFNVPKNFFHKYKDEIEEMRKSRTSLRNSMQFDANIDQKPVATVRPNQLRDGQQELHASSVQKCTETNSQSLANRTMTNWTVSNVPIDWNIPDHNHKSLVQAAAECDANLQTICKPLKNQYTLCMSVISDQKNDSSPTSFDDILDSVIISRTNRQHIAGIATAKIHYANGSAKFEDKKSGHSAIFIKDPAVMEKCKAMPHLAAEILKNESLWIQCAYCTKINQISDQHDHTMISCQNCYAYYCNRTCFASDSIRHQCTQSRIGVLAEKVTGKVMKDPESIYRMSLMARGHHPAIGRGYIDFRFPNIQMAEKFVAQGWRALENSRGQIAGYLHYCPLVSLQKNVQLIDLCRSYDPKSKFILNVSIMIDQSKIEPCGQPVPKQEVGQPSQKSITVPPNIEYIDLVPSKSAPIDALPGNKSKIQIQTQPPKRQNQGLVVRSMLRSMNVAVAAGFQNGTSNLDNGMQYQNSMKSAEETQV